MINSHPSDVDENNTARRKKLPIARTLNEKQNDEVMFFVELPCNIKVSVFYGGADVTLIENCFVASGRSQ